MQGFYEFSIYAVVVYSTVLTIAGTFVALQNSKNKRFNQFKSFVLESVLFLNLVLLSYVIALKMFFVD